MGGGQVRGHSQKHQEVLEPTQGLGGAQRWQGECALKDLGPVGMMSSLAVRGCSTDPPEGPRAERGECLSVCLSVFVSTCLCVSVGLCVYVYVNVVSVCLCLSSCLCIFLGMLLLYELLCLCFHVSGSIVVCCASVC